MIAVRRAWLPLLLYVVLGCLILVPLALVLYASLIDQTPFSGAPHIAWTAANYAALWSPDLGSAALNTAIVAAGGTIGAMLIGTVLAWLAARSDIAWKPFVQLVGIMPLFLSVLVASTAWSELAAGRTGYFNIVLAQLHVPFSFNVESLSGIAFVYAIYYAPYPFLFVYDALMLVHPEMEEAAGVHGARLPVILRRVTLPLIKPALLGATLLVFALIIEDFPVPQILGGPVGIQTISTRIYTLVTGGTPQPNFAAAVSVLLMIVTGTFVFAQRRLLRGADYRTVTGKGMRSRVLPLRALRLPALVLVLLYAGIALGAPAFALLEGSLRSNVYIANAAALFDVHALSLQPFLAALTDPDVAHGLLMSVLSSVCAAVAGTLLFLAVAYVVYRTAFRWRQPLEYLAMLPLAVPALVLGLGILWTWISLPVPVYGTFAILSIAYLTRFFPQGYRAVVASITQIHDDLENAARVCGAGRLRVMRSITLPLVRGGVTSALFITLVLSLRELTGSLFLYTTQTRTLAIVIYEKYITGSWSAVASISLVFTIALMAVTLAGRRWLNVRF